MNKPSQITHTGRTGLSARASAIPVIMMAFTLLAGCSMAPFYERPAAPVPQTYGEAAPENAALPPLPTWQEYFTQPALQELISKALASNRDLRIAMLRIDEAAAMYRIQRSERLPSVAASGAYFRGRANETGTGQTPVGERYSAGVGVVSFEVDLWGRVKSLSDASLARYLSTEEAARSAEISLIAQVVSLYMTERSLAAQEALTIETVEARETTRKLTEKRLKAGMATEIELHGNEMLVESARSTLAALQRERSVAGNALKLLLGDPSYTLPQNGPDQDEFSFARLAAGLPSDLLERRPDIRAAEQRLLAANADIGAARAAFFPRIGLSTEIGSASMELEKLFTSGMGFWSFVPNLVAPIFQGGRNVANLDLAETRKHIAVAEYEKSIQNAFVEVLNALNAGTYTESQITAQQKVVKADSERLRLVTLRYDQGLASYLELLDAQRSIFESKRELIRLKTLRLDSAITLYKALGGGWSRPVE